VFQLRSAVCTLMVAGAVVSSETAPQVLHEWAKDYAKKYPGEPMRLPGPVGDTPAKTIAELTRGAEVVFHARVAKLKTYIGRDGERILTDYAIQNQHLLAGRTAGAVARALDTSKPLVVTVIGGDLTIEGVEVHARASDSASVVDGDEYILFLMPSRGGQDRYEPYNAGIFAVQEGKVKPLHINSDILFKDAFDAPLETVLAKIDEARHR
jgi:hypothetical protein